jgi:hypothetical protein
MNLNQPDTMLKNVKAFIQGHLRSYYAKYDLLPEHIREQVEYRSIACKPCLQAGQCAVCKCKTPELFFADKACPGGKYGEMLDAENWDKFKGL